MVRIIMACLLVLLGGCGDKTGILIEVTSGDLSIPADIDALRFVVVSDRGTRVDETYPLESAWPHSLTILPDDNGSSQITVTITGMREGEARLQRVIRATFESGVTRRVDVVLGRDCLDVICPDGVGCLAGRCDEQPERDGGVEEDGGRADGGLDAGPFDAGTVPDAGGGEGDAGADSGVLDGGSDGGAEPVPCVDAACRGLIVISEMRTRGPAGALDEFVELYNRSSVPVDLDGLVLEYVSASGSAATRATVPGTLIVPPGGFVLLAGESYGGVPAVDVAERWTTGFADGGGSIRIRAGDVIVDLFGWGSAEAANAETTPFPDTCEATSCMRKAHATSTAASMAAGGADEHAGNGQDTDDNAADFVESLAADPQNLASPPEPR